MRRVFTACIILITVGMLVFISIPSVAGAKGHKAVVLKMWCAWPVKNYPSHPANEIFMNLANKYGKNVKLSVKIIGGPEVFKTFQGVESELNGVFDLAVTAPSYYVGVVPEAYSVMLNQHTPWKSRASGLFKLLDKYHQRAGLKFVAWYGYPGYFQAYSNFDVPKPDLTGKVMRTAPIYDPLVRKLGGTPTTVSPREIYDALSRKMVDGFFWLNQGIQDFGWHEVVKYYWGQHTPYVSDAVIHMNLDSWNGLDKDQKAALTKAAEQLEHDMAKVGKQKMEQQYKALIGSGKLKQIKFSDADYKYYRKTALDTAWEYVISKAADAANLRPLMGE